MGSEGVHSDINLTERSRTGDRDAFGILVQRYQNDLYMLANRLVSSRDEAEDIIQEAFIHAWRKIKNFRGDSSLKTWLWQIVVNLCRSHLRRRYITNRIFFWQQPAGDTEFEHQWPDHDGRANPAGYVNQKNLEQAVKSAAKLLSSREHEVFTLKFYQSMKTGEISRILSLSENTVKVLLYRALRKMAGALKEFQYEL